MAQTAEALSAMGLRHVAAAYLASFADQVVGKTRHAACMLGDMDVE